jgi:hypothetical protein
MLNIQYEISYSLNISYENVEILNKKIKEIYDCWINENINRKLLLINNNFNDIKLINDKIELFKNI